MKQKFINIQKTCDYAKPNILISQKNQFQTTYISILEDAASGEQVDDIEKIIVKNLFKI